MNLPYHLAIITPSVSASNLARTVGYVENQSANGLNLQLIIVVEEDFIPFLSPKIPLKDIKIIKHKKGLDKGCRARDIGISLADAEYVSFWDDDNIYYPHAAVSLYLTALNHDIGIVNTYHNGYIIPNDNDIAPGYIDTMCMCIKKDVAIKIKWADDYGRYSDYKYLSKLLALNHTVNRTNIIIGHHL